MGTLAPPPRVRARDPTKLPSKLRILDRTDRDRLSPVAGPALLALYSDDKEGVSKRFDLLPADQGVDVILLRPFNSVGWDRTKDEEGITFAAPSQVGVDCLTGTGRMPSEGEAILTWMSEDEERWRLPSLDALPRRAVTA